MVFWFSAILDLAVDIMYSAFIISYFSGAGFPFDSTILREQYTEVDFFARW